MPHNLGVGTVMPQEDHHLQTASMPSSFQVARDELLDEEEYNDIVDDITEEIETKYGHIQNIAIPRPTSPEDQVGCCYHSQMGLLRKGCVV